MKWNGVLFESCLSWLNALQHVHILSRHSMLFTIWSLPNVHKMSNEGPAWDERIREKSICKVRNCKGATSVYPCFLNIWISKASKCSDTPQNTHFLWTAWLTSHPYALATSHLIYNLLSLSLFLLFLSVTHSLVLSVFLSLSFPLFPSLFPCRLFFILSLPRAYIRFSLSLCPLSIPPLPDQRSAYQTRKWPSVLIKVSVSLLFPCRGEACAFTNSLFPFLTSPHPPWAL